jgi:alkylation response protein AidB-like acyl-CoA dehydrogenase
VGGASSRFCALLCARPARSVGLVAVSLGVLTCTYLIPTKIFDIFEGTEQIQQLVISRAITGLRVE